MKSQTERSRAYHTKNFSCWRAPNLQEEQISVVFFRDKKKEGRIADHG